MMNLSPFKLGGYSCTAHTMVGKSLWAQRFLRLASVKDLALLLSSSVFPLFAVVHIQLGWHKYLCPEPKNRFRLVGSVLLATSVFSSIRSSPDFLCSSEKRMLLAGLSTMCLSKK